MTRQRSVSPRKPPPRWARRVRSVSAVTIAAGLGTLTAPLWLPLAAVADVVRGKFRLPTVRLGAFGVMWAWLEVVGVTRAGWLWLTGRAGNRTAHYELQRWWVRSLSAALTATTGLRAEVEGVEALAPGPVLVVCRHSSLADSIISAWIISERARMQPHYVLKKELLQVPNLDIVGNRLPNVFLDRSSPDSAAELDRLREMAARLGPDDVAVIFPEGTRASDDKRARALARIAESDPDRAARLGGLAHLIPPRPNGTLALLQGNPELDVVVAAHVGLDGLDSFPAVLRHLTRRPPVVRFTLQRFERDELPSDDELGRWLDDRWLDMDRHIAQQLTSDRRSGR